MIEIWKGMEISLLADMEICHHIIGLLTVQSQMDREKLWQHKIDEDLEEKSQLDI